MKYLTFLDYTTLKNSSRSIETKIEEKDKENMYLRQRLEKVESVVQFLMEQKESSERAKN